MSQPSSKALAQALLEHHGHSYAEEAGIRLERNTPSPLFRLLCLSMLLSARIRADIAVAACRALGRAGWRTPERMVKAGWAERARVLNQSGYARYDERTSTMLEESSQLLLDRWHGDLRQLRQEAGRQPDVEQRLLQQVKGIGKVGTDIFCREAQVVWDELRPFVDERALKAASELGLGDRPEAVGVLVPGHDLARLVAALVRLSLAGDYEEMRAAARARAG
jgi:hypothetical protein